MVVIKLARQPMNSLRSFSFFDRLCLNFDQTLRALTDNAPKSTRPYPAAQVAEGELNPEERRHAAGLMRVNHAGEIAAQALYHGQGLVARHPEVQGQLQQAAIEEGDHLAWCRQRLDELDSHTSYLKPLWYVGSFSLGIVAGLVGDQWSLGFVAETEKQVVKHLQSQLRLLPKQDYRSYHILAQMEKDEAHHQAHALAAGAAQLPYVATKAMAFTARIMVRTAYWI